MHTLHGAQFQVIAGGTGLPVDKMKTEGTQARQVLQTASRLNSAEAAPPTNIGFIGTHGWSSQLLLGVLGKPEFQVQIYETTSEKAKKFAELGATATDCPTEVAETSHILVCATANIKELEDHLFHSQNGVLSGTRLLGTSGARSNEFIINLARIVLPKNCIVLTSAQCRLSDYPSLLRKIADKGRPDVSIVDTAPLSASRHGQGKGLPTLLFSGPVGALADTRAYLNNATSVVCPIPGGLGQASKIEMVNNLLTSLHTAAAAEAMGLAAKAGLNTKVTFDIISNAAGSSSAFETRVPHMLSGDWQSPASLQSTLDDLVRHHRLAAPSSFLTNLNIEICHFHSAQSSIPAAFKCCR